MNKKILTVVLVVLFAVTSVFAYKGEMKVGASMGLGFDGWGYTINEDEKTSQVGMYGGFCGSANFQYGLTNSLYLKGEVGINTFSKYVKVKTNEEPVFPNVSPRKPNFLVSAAVVYDIPIGTILNIDLQIGVDTAIGKPSYGSEESDIAIGLGLGLGLGFNITQQISLGLNAKLSAYMANTNAKYAELLKADEVALLGLQNNIYVTYSL